MVVKGNPAHFKESLDSIKGFVKEIIIADIGMDPSASALLKGYEIRIIPVSEPVPYVELIREKIKKEAKEEYVLFLDPDEVIPETLKKEWALLLGKYDHVATPRKNLIFGSWIRHSRWWPDYQTRLFRKGAVVWPTIIHQQPQTTGTGTQLAAEEDLAILHYNYESIDEYLAKAARYAKSESGRLQAPPSLHGTIQTSVSEFISRFFADEGYRDGIRGFILAFFQMIYPFLVYFYYLESAQFSAAPEGQDLIRASVSFPGKLYKESLHWKNRKSGSSLKEKLAGKLIDE